MEMVFTTIQFHGLSNAIAMPRSGTHGVMNAIAIPGKLNTVMHKYTSKL